MYYRARRREIEQLKALAPHGFSESEQGERAEGGIGRGFADEEVDVEVKMED